MVNFLLGVIVGGFIVYLVMSIEVPTNDDKDNYWGDF